MVFLQPNAFKVCSSSQCIRINKSKRTISDCCVILQKCQIGQVTIKEHPPEAALNIIGLSNSNNNITTTPKLTIQGAFNDCVLSSSHHHSSSCQAISLSKNWKGKTEILSHILRFVKQENCLRYSD